MNQFRYSHQRLNPRKFLPIFGAHKKLKRDARYHSRPLAYRYSIDGGFLRHSTVVLFLAGICSVYAIPANAGQATITVAYSPMLDSICSFFRGGQIQDEWKMELKSRKPEFEELWAAVGPSMIDATEAITGKLFPAENVIARLTLCDLPSQSSIGISVNMRYALESFTTTPVPIRYKVDTLFHELLHRFLAEYPAMDSALLKQHVSEPERTRNHLHLLALQKAVLLRLNETEALKSVIAIDSQLPGGYYKRAWEIINATDTEYLKYIDELSRLAARHSSKRSLSLPPINAVTRFRFGDWYHVSDGTKHTAQFE